MKPKSLPPGDLWKADLVRYGGGKTLFFRSHAVRFLWALRRGKHSPFAKLLHRRMVARYGLEIPQKAEIGPGLYLGHAFCITVNPEARIGSDCNLHKGVTVGQENRGKRKGAPIIGDRVWIGVNSSVVGKITVGDDVLIAPNTYVNCDVPSHSVVLGSPCRIIPRDNATEGYINKMSQRADL